MSMESKGGLPEVEEVEEEAAVEKKLPSQPAKKTGFSIRKFARNLLLAGAVTISGAAIINNANKDQDHNVSTPSASETIKQSPEASANASNITVAFPEATPTESAQGLNLVAISDSSYDTQLEHKYFQQSTEWKISLLNEEEQKIRNKIIATLDDNGQVTLNDTVTGAVMMYDKNDDSFIVQIVSNDGKEFNLENNKMYFYNGELQVENYLRSQGVSQKGICNFNLRQSLDPAINKAPMSDKVTLAPVSCFIDTTKISSSSTN